MASKVMFGLSAGGGRELLRTDGGASVASKPRLTEIRSRLKEPSPGELGGDVGRKSGECRGLTYGDCAGLSYGD